MLRPLHTNFIGILPCLLATYFGFAEETKTALPRIKNETRHVLTEADVDAIQEAALAVHSGRIQTIQIGQMYLPSGTEGALVIFESLTNGTHQIDAYVEVWNPTWLSEGETPLRYALEKDLTWQTTPHSLSLYIRRVFSLKTARLVLSVPDKMSYEEVLELLISVENGTCESIEDPRPSPKSGFFARLFGRRKPVFDSIVRIHGKPEVAEISKLIMDKDGNLEMWIGTMGGDIFYYKKGPDGRWRLYGSGSWNV